MNAEPVINDIGNNNSDKSATSVHDLSFQHDKGGEHQTTHRRTGFDMPQTSSDTEVVEIIFMRLFAARSKGSSKAFCPLYYHSIAGI